MDFGNISIETDLTPKVGKWYYTRNGTLVKVVATDLPSTTGHSVMAIHYGPSTWGLQTLLANGRVSESTNMPEDLVHEAMEPTKDEPSH